MSEPVNPFPNYGPCSVQISVDNVGRTFSAASISKYLKSENRAIDNETVYNYLSKLESAYILHRCSRFDIQGKEILKTQEKFYLADPALRYSVLGYSPDSVAAMLENIIRLVFSSGRFAGEGRRTV